jgi:hypothetical protein
MPPFVTLQGSRPRVSTFLITFFTVKRTEFLKRENKNMGLDYGPTIKSA